MATANWQLDANSISEDFRHYEVNRKSVNVSQMPIRTFLRIGNRQRAVKCQFEFTNSYELATGNWQPDANSILDGIRR